MMSATDAGTAGSRYAAATQALRATTRWILTAFAATGGLLVTGLQLKQLGGLDWHSEPARFAVACGFVLVGVGGVIYIVILASAIFMDEWVTLTQLGQEMVDGELEPPTDDAEKKRQATRHDLEVKVNEAAPELFAHVAPDLHHLYAQLRIANERSATLIASQTPADNEPSVLTHAQVVQAAAAAAIDCANYHRTLWLVRSRIMRFTVAAVVILIAVAGFAVAASDDKPNACSATTQSKAAGLFYCAPLASRSSTR